MQATDGNFYGTTYYGGDPNCADSVAYGCGTVFKITPNGFFSTVYVFEGSDGSNPGGMVQGTDGKMYGTTAGGGANNHGTFFKITLSGTLTSLYSFAGADGEDPTAAPIQGTDGNFYGTTLISIYKITSTGTLTTLDLLSGYSYSPLVQATDGNFYGTVWDGGNRDKDCTSTGCGTIFKITPAGILTTLHAFDATDGEQPYAGMIQATSGDLLGVTSFGGTSFGGGTAGDGTVFTLSVGLGPFVETRPTSGKVGSTVDIVGDNLSGSTAVTFNGTPATFTVVSDTEITTTVPTGASSGPVKVTSSTGTLKSNIPFRVRP